MKVYRSLIIEDFGDFLPKLRNVISAENNSMLLNSNGWGNDIHGEYDFLAGVGISSEMLYDGEEFYRFKEFVDETKDWLFCMLSYDLKNSIENLRSNNFDGLNSPTIKVFKPSVLIILNGKVLKIYVAEENFPSSKYLADDILHDLHNLYRGTYDNSYGQATVHQRVTKEQYVENVETIKNHILRGDVYELNYCQEFYVENYQCQPFSLYERLCNYSPSPFSAFCRFGDFYVLSSSPERFLKKKGLKILSQPMKGTARRFNDRILDENAVNELLNSEKERAENIMIVDLVRNDLAKTAKQGSVKVDELCGVYSFRHVHQMISTVSSTLGGEHHFVDSIKSCFPMGSMTGAPKIKAMELIEQYEVTKRGVFSGAIGYITPSGDFDFNVVIRSLVYNEANRYLSIITGGAITSESDPLLEYEESLLKAEALIKIL